MKLGEVVQINIGVVDLEQSLAFYHVLGFRKIDQSSMPYPWAQLTDGQNLLLLNQDGNQYVGLGYFSGQAAEKVGAMEKMGVTFRQKREQDGRLFMAIFSGPGDLIVGLIHQDPTGMPRPEGLPLSRCGKFGELALNVADFTTAADFWGRLGFDRLFESSEPYPWGILHDGCLPLGLHQSGGDLAFEGPALTYFAADMAERIAALKADGLVFAREMAAENGRINNAILHGPDGEKIFLFEGEI